MKMDFSRCQDVCLRLLLLNHHLPVLHSKPDYLRIQSCTFNDQPQIVSLCDIRRLHMQLEGAARIKGNSLSQRFIARPAIKWRQEAQSCCFKQN